MSESTGKEKGPRGEMKGLQWHCERVARKEAQLETAKRQRDLEMARQHKRGRSAEEIAAVAGMGAATVKAKIKQVENSSASEEAQEETQAEEQENGELVHEEVTA